MVGFILASHSEFSVGLKKAAEMVFGEQENMEAVSLLPKESADDLREKLLEAISHMEDQNNIVIFTDLYGATPFNQAKKVLEGHEDKWAVVAGMNLPMMITAIVNRMGPSTAKEVAHSVLKDSKNSIRIYPAEAE
ncbi:MAG: PTS sugar transporter subunit IIA [Eubacteriales bacterium]|nr:PTS sugar transporter subunit IIA [Eubacteriales bacterium]